jgi:hypothetical protein
MPAKFDSSGQAVKAHYVAAADAGDPPSLHYKRADPETKRHTAKADDREPDGITSQLQDALTAAMQRTNTTRFEAVRSCAHELAIEWLRSH